jgi:glutathione S-transferase
MQDFVIHSVPGSPYGRAVLVALEEKGQRYRLAPVTPGTTRSPEHLALHPFGRIPILVHGDFRLYETQAILRYLDRILPQPALTPAEPQAAARMDMLMNVNDWYLFQGVGTVIVFQRVVGPRVLGLVPDEQIIAAALPQGHLVFDELSRRLGDAQFFGGELLTLADIILAPHLDMFRATPEWARLTAQTPNLVAWMSRLNERPSMVATTWERVAAMAKVV